MGRKALVWARRSVPPKLSICVYIPTESWQAMPYQGGQSQQRVWMNLKQVPNRVGAVHRPHEMTSDQCWSLDGLRHNHAKHAQVTSSPIVVRYSTPVEKLQTILGDDGGMVSETQMTGNVKMCEKALVFCDLDWWIPR